MSEAGELSYRWGTPKEPVTLEPDMREFLREHVGIANPWPAQGPDEWALPEGRMSADDLAALASVVGDDHVATDRASRLAHLGGASYTDYARRRSGDAADAPDAVVSPDTHEQVVDVLRLCSARGIAVVPLGGGTSVVGGLRAGRSHIALSLRRMNALVDLDTTSAIAHVEPGITGPRLEALLAARGFTLGHLPQSWQRASIGGYVATRSSGQASTGYGRSDDMVESLTVATPAGSLHLGRGPSSAAGPDLRELFVGSEGSLGVITRVGLRVRRLPEERIYEGVLLPDFAAGREAFREAAQSRATADVMRLSDADETRTTLLMSAPGGVVGAALERYLRVRGIDGDRASLAILGWEGVDRDTTRDRRSATWRVLKRHGAVSLGRRAGQSWRRHRFEGPFLRDALMDAGYLVETVETATSWAALPALHDAVNAALANALGPRPGPYVMSHVSHVYETGASLYTTVIAVADQSDPVGQWARAKRAVGDAIAAEGATITHHHAVGRDHAPWLEGEIGPLGIDVLRSVKDRVDPEGVMNPGNLLPE
ncbi:MAG: FAD-binding oxidoreductase [Actinomycetota bacterium]